MSENERSCKFVPETNGPSMSPVVAVAAKTMFKFWKVAPESGVSNNVPSTIMPG